MSYYSAYPRLESERRMRIHGGARVHYANAMADCKCEI